MSWLSCISGFDYRSKYSERIRLQWRSFADATERRSRATQRQSRASVFGAIFRCKTNVAMASTEQTGEVGCE